MAAAAAGGISYSLVRRTALECVSAGAHARASELLLSPPQAVIGGVVAVVVVGIIKSS